MMTDQMEGLVDEDVEMAFVGCMIQDNEAPGVAQANFDIVPEMLYSDVNQLLVQEIYELNRKKHGYVDGVILSTHLRQKGLFKDIGGLPYLQACMDKAPVSVNLRHYCEQIKNLHLKRQLLKVSQQVAGEARETLNAQEFLMEVPQRYFDLMPTANNDISFADSLEAIVQQWRDIRDGKLGMPGLSTGIPELDKVMTGLKPGSYNIIAARPGSGKTSLAGNIMDYNCQEGEPVFWVNMDMPRFDLEQRWLSHRSGVSLPKLYLGKCFGKDFAKIEAAQKQMQKWPLHALHAVRDISKICAQIRLKVKNEGVKLIVVDYIQKCSADHIRSHDPVRVISYCSAAIKETCQELNVPLLVLAQLGRPDPRAGKFAVPTMDNLKGCGDLEQDAQTATLLYKDPRFNYEVAGIDERKQRALVLDVAKLQNGEPGQMEFWFHAHYFKMIAAPKDWGHPKALVAA